MPFAFSCMSPQITLNTLMSWELLLQRIARWLQTFQKKLWNSRLQWTNCSCVHVHSLLPQIFCMIFAVCLLDCWIVSSTHISRNTLFHNITKNSKHLQHKSQDHNTVCNIVTFWLAGNFVLMSKLFCSIFHNTVCNIATFFATFAQKLHFVFGNVAFGIPGLRKTIG